MSGDMSTQVDRPYARQPETRVAAVAQVVRRGYPDILAALGLDDVEGPDLGACPYCTTRLARLCVWHGEHATAPAAVPRVPVVVDGRQCCPRCGKPLPDPVTNGGFKTCQRRACGDAVEPAAEVAAPAEPEPQGYRVVGGRMICTRCSRRVRADGICRQRYCGGAR